MDLSFVHLHTPAFLNGNLGDKITVDPKIATVDLKLDWLKIGSTEELFVFVTRNGAELIMPLSNVIGFKLAKESQSVKLQEIAAAPKGKIKAQASSPMDHVHQGLGAGKTND